MAAMITVPLADQIAYIERTIAAHELVYALTGRAIEGDVIRELAVERAVLESLRSLATDKEPS